jgi:hypothetical protein
MTSFAGIFALAVILGNDDPLTDQQIAIVRNNNQHVSFVANDTAKAPPAAFGQGTSLGGGSSVSEVPVLQDLPVLSRAAVEQRVPARPAQARGPVLREYRLATRINSVPGLEKVVSLSLKNKTAADVLQWMNKQGVNFAVNVDSLPKNRITLNMTNVPLHEVLSTVGEVLGGSWDVRNKTLIFQKHSASRGFATFPAELPMLPPMGGMEFVPAQGFAAPEMNFTFEPPKFKLEEFKMDFDGQEEPMKVMKIRLEALTEDIKVQAKKGMMDEKLAKDLQTRIEATMKDCEVEAKVMAVQEVEVDKFLKSITKEQKELMKKQGFLKLSDLTDAQLKFLKAQPRSEAKQFNLMLMKGDEKIIIKN